MQDVPRLIQGRKHIDGRGTVSYINDFLFDGVKRFYLIEHADTKIARAWQGHQQEQKWFYVVSGIFKVVIVKPDNWVTPVDAIQIEEFELHAGQPGILFVPGGFVNGFKALEPNSKMIVYSNFSVEESANDDFRFDSALWFDWEANKVRN